MNVLIVSDTTTEQQLVWIPLLLLAIVHLPVLSICYCANCIHRIASPITFLLDCVMRM